MKNTNIGSVSSDTMRPEDLIPSFLWELKRQKPLKKAHRALIKDIEERMEADDYYESEDSEYDLNESLFDALDEYAPAYFYFGAHPSDGADFGFWLREDFEQEFDGPKVSSSDELPKDYFGEFLIVNDHGNMTLMVRHRNYRVTEIWAVV